MDRNHRITLLAIAVVALLAVPAFAEDGVAPNGNGDMSDRDAAIREVPTYEDESPTEMETPNEAFLVLAEDYIFLSEIGGRSQGRVPVWPRGAIKLGPFQIFPYLTGRIGWTNNTFDNEERGESWYARTGAGFAGSATFAGGRGSFGIGVDYVHTDHFSGEDESYSELVGGAGFTYRFANGFWFSAGVKWEHLVDPVDIQFVDELRRDQFYPYVEMGLTNAFGNKIDITFGVNYFNANFDDQEFDSGDRSGWNAWVRAAYPFLQNHTQIFVQYDFFYSRRDSERINDLESGHEVTAGLEGQIPITKSERLTGEIGVGYRSDLYDSPRALSIGSGSYPTDDDRRAGVLTVHGALRYLAGPNTSFDLRLLRTIQFSAVSNFQIINRADLAVTHNCLRNLVSRIGIFGEVSDPSGDGSQGGQDMSRFGVGIGSRYMLFDMADLDFAVNWARRNTSKQGYDTSTVDASLGVTIYFK